MSHFLDNLVARSLSRVETVQPQVISLFEPPPANKGSIFQDSAATEPLLVDHEINESIAERLGQVQSLWHAETGQDAVAISPLIAQERSEPDLESRRLSSIKRPEQMSTGPIAIRPGASGEPLSNVSAKPPRRSVKRKRTAIAPDFVENAQDLNGPNESSNREVSMAISEWTLSLPARGTPTRAKETTLVKPELKDPNASRSIIEKKITETIGREHQVKRKAGPAREVKITKSQSVSSSRSVPAQEPGVSGVPPVAPIVPVSIVVSPRLLPAPPKENAGKAPSVYITIGRVEVRATTLPPARARSQSAAAPVMSLEKYLRQRAQGDQR